MPENIHFNNLTYLSGAGEMATLTREFNWENSVLGAVNTWPKTLLTVLGVVLNSSFPMFVFWSKELTCFYNDAYRPSLGNNGKHPAVGKSAPDVWPEIWPFIGPIIDQVMNTGKAVWFEDQLLPIYRNSRLEEVYWTFSYSPILGDGASIEGVFVTCTETTQKVQAFKGIQITNQRFNNLVQQASVGIIVLIGPEMTVNVVNSNYGTLIGRSVDELQGKNLFDVIPEAESVFRPILDKVRISGEALFLFSQPYSVNTMTENKSGYLDLVYQPYFEVDGSITGVMVLCYDVTEQYLSIQKIELEKQRAQLAIEAAALGVFELDYKTNGLITDKRFNEIWGFDQPAKRDEYTSKILPEDLITRNKILKEATISGDFNYEVRINPREGEQRWVKVYGKILYGDSSEPKTMYGVVSDITEEKEYAQTIAEINDELAASNEELKVSMEELTESNEALVKVNADLDTFIYTASHDLKAPITNIEALVNDLKGSLPVSMEEEALINQLIDFIEGSIKRFNHTIADLTSVAMIQKEDDSIPTLVSLKDVLDEVLLDLEFIIKKTEPIIDFDPTCSLVQFSRKNLRSIVYNLVSNSIKYKHSERRPKISIKCRNEGKYQVISFSDNGMGMNLKKDHKLFKMFGRLHHHVEGTGVGLHMVKKIIENSGGKIQVHSEENVGSTFDVFIIQEL